MQLVSRRTKCGARSAFGAGRQKAAENLCHGQDENLQVQPEREVLDVEVVPLGAICDRRPAAQPVYLSPPRDARLDPVAFGLAVHVLAESSDVLGPFRPRPHKAHLTAEDVDQLRQLVNVGASQEFAEPRDPVDTFDAARAEKIDKGGD